MRVARAFWSRCGLVLHAALATSCASATPAFPLRPPLTRDPDRRPFHGALEPYFSPTEWDGFDQSFFRPVARFLAVEPGGEAVNVNTLDEAPDSSWFQNRVERLDLQAMALGPCSTVELEAPPPWQIVAGKPDGAYPGFIIEDATGQRYLIKLEGGLQGFHNSIADVVGSRLYFAAGFDVPCNQVAYFNRWRSRACS
jgi:hypothetical protein